MTVLYRAIVEYIQENVGIQKISLRAITKIIGISRNGFSSWIHRKPSKQQRRKEEIKKIILEIHRESKEIYGAPKITRVLWGRGIRISEKTVGSYMHELGIQACYIKPRTKTTVSEDFTTKLKNILKRKFDPERPDAAWCTDITYIWTYEDGFVYLTSVMDIYSRKIVSWVLTKDMRAESVLQAIRLAKERRELKKPLIIHSDRRSAIYK